jgi:hypothetical protein
MRRLPSRRERCGKQRDDGSKNGLLLDGAHTDGALLVDGDWIEPGHTLLRDRHGAMPPARQPRRPTRVRDITLTPPR